MYIFMAYMQWRENFVGKNIPSIFWNTKRDQTKHERKSTLKPWYNEPRYSEFCDIVNKIQLLFLGFTKHITSDIVNYLIEWTKRVWQTSSLYRGLSVRHFFYRNTLLIWMTKIKIFSPKLCSFYPLNLSQNKTKLWELTQIELYFRFWAHCVS